MGEGQPGECHGPCGERCEHRRQCLGARQGCGNRFGPADIGDDDHRPGCRQAGDDLGELCGNVDILAGIVVAVAGDEDLRLDLSETIESATRPEIGRGRRPDRADRSRREHGGNGLGEVRHQGGDTIAGDDAPR